MCTKSKQLDFEFLSLPPRRSVDSQLERDGALLRHTIHTELSGAAGGGKEGGLSDVTAARAAAPAARRRQPPQKTQYRARRWQ